MLWSQTFIPTLKETPADAEIVSHQLLLRAGLVRKLTGGLYTFLPLGLKVLRKIEQIIREEMNRAGGIEVLMPALQPIDIWQQSGRYETASGVLFKVRDSARKEWVLGPTHEEVITSLAANELNSYRQLPKNFYQIQTKFRDEIRPRFGLMRAKEFLMKDAYSFDATDAGAMTSYHKMYDAYTRIFARCGLQAFPVEADTGVRRWKGGLYGSGQTLLVDDLILIQSERGDVALAAASPDAFRELGRITALSSKTWNHPTLAGRYLLVRNDREAVCYELPLAPPATAASGPARPRQF